MKFPWTKTPLSDGKMITLQVRNSKLVPSWWDMVPRGTSPYERGYDQGFLDGINLRYRAEQKGTVPI